MSIKFNNKFAYATFEEEARELNKDVHCLTFQTEDMYKKLLTDGVYRANVEYGSRDGANDWYKRAEKQLGYVPIWVFNPLQFGEVTQCTWDTEWFREGGLWQRFMELAGFDRETIHERVLLEVRVNSCELKKDINLDYGCISIIKELHKEDVVGVYRLAYPDEDADDWYYPWIYPYGNNSELASFKHIMQFDEECVYDAKSTLRPGWIANLVRRNSIDQLKDNLSTEQLRQMWFYISGKISKSTNSLKLAKACKSRFVNTYRNFSMDILIKNVQDFEYIHLLSFQSKEVLNTLRFTGEYVPSERWASEPETTQSVVDTLGYYPVWCFNPLMLGQRMIDRNAFNLMPYMGCLETAFPFHRHDISNDLYLYEFKIPTHVITEKNSSYSCTMLPKVTFENLVGVYQFYRNDPDCGYHNTAKCPYIKVVELFDDDIMTKEDYSVADAFGDYTGTAEDFDL